MSKVLRQLGAASLKSQKAKVLTKRSHTVNLLRSGVPSGTLHPFKPQTLPTSERNLNIMMSLGIIGLSYILLRSRGITSAQKALLEKERLSSHSGIYEQNRQAIELFYGGDLERSQRMFQGINSSSPGNVATLLNLSRVSYLKKDWDQAQQWVEKALKLEPNNATGLAILGKVRIKKKEFGPAKETLLEGLKQGQDSCEILLALGEVSELTGHWDEASDAYQKYLANPMANPLVLKILSQRIDKIRSIASELDAETAEERSTQ